MATTVNSAFYEFMSDSINIDCNKTTTARSSRDFLKGKIKGLKDFFPLYSDKDINFGSFARRTKIRPLDDIDMIFTLSANGCTWEDGYGGIVYINTPIESPEYKNFRHDNSYRLNSRKVINHFVIKLGGLSHYEKSELHRNKNAATLRLSSYEWNFDIVPAFFTAEDDQGKTFYLIPDGSGHWLKTDPRLDRQRVTEINQQFGGNVLTVIRAIKYWQRRAIMPSMSSYLLENLILNIFEEKGEISQFVDINIIHTLFYMKDKIWSDVNDPKGIQGNLNTLSWDDKFKISQKAETDFNIALAAHEFEQAGDHKKAIGEWRRVFGNDFPQYG